MEIAGLLTSRWPSAKKNFSSFKIQLIPDLSQEFGHRFTN
jgi:hypothetical protein